MWPSINLVALPPQFLTPMFVLLPLKSPPRYLLGLHVIPQSATLVPSRSFLVPSQPPGHSFSRNLLQLSLTLSPVQLLGKAMDNGCSRELMCQYFYTVGDLSTALELSG